MKLIVCDFESYYDAEYSLSKMTTEAYVRSPKFETIMVGLKVNDEPTYTVVGSDIFDALCDLDIPNSAMLCHHAHFDGLILGHHYGLKPKIWFDTLSMGRAELGSVVAKGMSLGSMSEHLGLGVKGHEVVLAKGKHLADFEEHKGELEDYRRYCCNDVDLTYKIYQKLRPSFSTSELKLIDLTTRLFTEPVLESDTELLEKYRKQVLENKERLMFEAHITRAELMSNNRFAEVLRAVGVEPGMKDSPTAKNEDGTPKRTYAFAKTDEFMKELVESDDELVQALGEARLGVKTTIAETRAQRFIDMSKNGPACVYLKYWGAEQTGRMSGGDKMNWQNLGRTVKGQIGLRDTVHAPEGYVLVVGDSSNIEARTVCWIAGQEDILEKYRNGEDLYCDMAADVYGRPVTKTDKTERMLGKIAVLGLGYGMGKKKFFATVTGPQWKVDIEQAVTDYAVNVFRNKYDKVAEFWQYQNDEVIPAMADGKTLYTDSRGILTTTQYGLLLPNGRTLRYPDLHQRKNEDPDSPFKTEWVFHIREGSRVIKTRTYGGHLTENICQALARIIVMDQAVEISRRYKVVMLVHDEVVCCVPEEQAEECKAFMLEVMRKTPAWAEGLPLDAEVGIGKVYSQAK